MITDVEIAQESTEIPNISQELIIPRWQQFQKISKLSWQMSLSYTFSLEMVVLVYLLSQVNKSENHLAAITLITTLINFLICVGVSPLLAMSLVAGKELGELNDAITQGETEQQLFSRRQHISAVFINGLILSAITAPVVVSGMVFSKPILLNVLHQNAEVAQITEDFVRPYSIAVPAIMVRVCADQVMYLFERTKPAMLIGLMNLSIGMALGSVLAFGKLGAPKMGSSGILIGAVLNEYLTAFGYSLYLMKSPRLQDYHFFNVFQSWQPYLNQLSQIRQLGRSIMFSMATETTMLFMLSSFAGMLGTEPQAAFSAIMQLSLFSFLLQVAFGQTAAQEISRGMGANQFQNASLAGKISLAALLIYIVPVLLFLSAYPTVLADIQANNNASYRNTLQRLAPIMFTGCVFDAIRFIILQQMRVLGDAKKSSVISSGCIGLGILSAGLVGLKTEMGIYGVATGYTAWVGIAAAILFIRWQNKIRPEVMQHTKNNPEQFLSFTGCCGSFFNAKRSAQSPQPNLNGQLVMIDNPLQRISLK